MRRGDNVNAEIHCHNCRCDVHALTRYGRCINCSSDNWHYRSEECTQPSTRETVRNEDYIVPAFDDWTEVQVNESGNEE